MVNVDHQNTIKKSFPVASNTGLFFFSFNAKVLSILDLKHAVHLSRVSNGFSRQSNHIAFWFSVHVSHFPYGSNDFFRPKPASGKELQQTQQHE